MADISLHCSCSKGTDATCNGGGEIISLPSMDSQLKSTLNSSADIESGATWERDSRQTLEALCEIGSQPSMYATMVSQIETDADIVSNNNFDMTLFSAVEPEAEIESLPDKNHGDFEYFGCQEKLYPLADLAIDSGFSRFTGSHLETENLYSLIDEGVYSNKMVDRGNPVHIADDNTFIQPDTYRTDGVFQYRCELSQFNVRPDESMLRMRLFTPLSTLEAKSSPLYLLYDIQLEDPSGVPIVEYEDVRLRGDDYYFTCAIRGRLNSYDWERFNSPDLHQGSGYQLSFKVAAFSLDDPFDGGFNIGFEENYNLPEIIHQSGNNYLALDGAALSSQETRPINPDGIRVAALEICNSGGFGPRIENYIPFYLPVQNIGDRLERKLYPTFMPLYNYESPVSPDVTSVWSYEGDTNENVCGSEVLVRNLREQDERRFATLQSTDVQDSGKIIVKFGGCSSEVNKVTRGAFNFEFDKGVEDLSIPASGAFNVENIYEDIYEDSIFYNFDSIVLNVLAKKHPSSSDYELDVVGYTEDYLIYRESFEETDYFDFDASGVFFPIEHRPVVSSTDFQWYQVPLNVFNSNKKQSPRLENLYADIYPIPSGASIAALELSVRYNPNSAFGMYTQGGENFGKRNYGIYPSGGEDYLNHGSGYAPLSTIEGIPHGYLSPDTLKTNYSRRWRGVNGVVNGPFDPDEFGFGFENPTIDYPFLSGYFKFDLMDGNAVYSHGIGEHSGVFSSTPEIETNLGWRLSSETLFTGQDTGNTTVDWTTFGDPLFGKIADAGDRFARLSPDNYVDFDNVDTSNGFSTFIRFSPDKDYGDLFESGVLFSKWQNDLDFALGYSGGFLCGYAKDSLGNIVSVADDIPYSGYQYPLSVIFSYEDSKLKLYTDNEFYKGNFNTLRASSSTFTNNNSSDNLTLGWSEGSGIGANIFVSEFGFSTSNIVESNPDRTNKEVSAEEFLENFRVTFFNPGDNEADDRYRLWDRVNENTVEDWYLGAFNYCEFDFDFDQWQKRPNTEYIVFDIENSGQPYSSYVDLPFPSSVSSGVSYHSQIENDFLRFNLSDVPDSFYAANRRITKNIPCGYKFSDSSLVVESVIDHQSSGNIVWDDCKETVGPKLIVSLYSKNLEPYWTTDRPWGLINRKAHYLDLNSCVHKLETKFEYGDLEDNSELWSIFPDGPRLDDFSERILSQDVNDMYVQYDLVYPSGGPYRSTIRLHSSHVRLDDANFYSVQENDNLNLYASGAFPADASLNMNIGAFPRENSGVLPLNINVPIPVSVLDDNPSGFHLSASGAFSAGQSMPLFTPQFWEDDSFSLFVSGEMPSSGNAQFNMAMPETFARHDSSDDNDPITSLAGSGSFFGVPLTLFNSELSQSPDGPVLSLNLYAADNTGIRDVMPLCTYSNIKNVLPGSGNAQVNLNVRGRASVGQKIISSSMPMYINAPQILNENLPLYIHNPEVESTDSGVLNFFTANYSDVGSYYGLWDSFNFGDGIDLSDNYAASIPVNDEIRGVDLIAYGSCFSDSTSKAIDQALITDCTVWREETCNDAGIFRAKSTYTNLDVGYSGNYYGIRKYTDLVPSVAYNAVLTAKTGSTDAIKVPNTFEEWEYGVCGPEWGADACCTADCDQNLAYSGIKLTDASGAAVAVSDDLLAVSSPHKTIIDSGNVEVSGAGSVTLYRRGEDVPGKKAGWEVIDELMLPLGYRKDYIEKTSDILLTFNDLSISGNKWQIGQEGREFGTSVDIGKDVVAVGAPRAKWSREFDDIKTSGIPTAAIVFADIFNYSKAVLSEVADTASQYNTLWKYFSAPWYDDWYPQINPKVLVFQLTYSNKDYPPVPKDEDSWFFHSYLPRLDDLDLLSNVGSGLLGGSGTLNDWMVAARPQIYNVMYSGVLDTFFKAFPNDPNAVYSNVPAIVGMFKEQTGSTAGALKYADENGVRNLYDDFTNFFHSYSVESGVYDQTTGLAQSGHLNTVIGRSEKWDETTKALLSDTFDSGRLSTTFTNSTLNRNFIASGIGQEWGDTHGPIVTEFQVPPASGGRVYIFENERGNFNCVQVISSPNDVLTYGKTYNDRFGHSVGVSKNDEVLTIGSPWNQESCQIYERDSSQHDLVYNNVFTWCQHKQKQEALSHYFDIVNLSGVEAAKLSLYDHLSPSERFEFRNDKDYWVTLPTPYVKTYEYGYGDIEYVGTRKFLPNTFAPTSRLGWSTAVSDDGDYAIFGAPTDSFNEFEDVNVWGDGEESWASYHNAGAVRVFNARKVYTHDKVVEIGRFGNLDRAVHNNKEDYDLDSVYGSGVWYRTEFSEVEIPQDAGLAFINTPEIDPISDELVDNIKNWLALGDRNLVIVGNDPVWEENGLYSTSNDVINKLLERLGSRMRLVPARNKAEAQVGCPDKYNVTAAKIPSYSTGRTVSNGNFYANGVADIKIDLSRDGLEDYVEYMSCPEGATCTDDEPPVINDKCEMPLKHLGDLRAEWDEQCLIETPQTCTVVPYKKNWPLQFGNFTPTCDDPPTPLFLKQNQEPVPVLTTAEHIPASSWYTPATSGYYCDYDPIYEWRVKRRGETTSRFKENNIDEVAFSIENNSGIFSSFTMSGDFIDPPLENGRDGFLQGVGEFYYPKELEKTEKVEVYDRSILALSEQVGNSKAFIIATQWSEDDASRGIDAATENDDKNTEFYINMVKKDCVNTPRGIQINGFTGQNSLRAAYGSNDHGLADKLTVEFNGNFQENKSTQDLTNVVDFAWIAQPLGKPSDGEIADLKSWMEEGDKKVIITYNDDQLVADNVNYLCEKLNISSRPFFLPAEGKYFVAENVIDNVNQVVNSDSEPIEGCPNGYSFTFPNYDYSTEVEKLHFDQTTRFVSYDKDRSNFIPISGGANFEEIVSFNEPVKEERLIVPNDQWKIDGEASIEFPTVKDSGYRMFINWVSEGANERFSICGTLRNTSSLDDEEDLESEFGGSPCPSDFYLSKTTNFTPHQTVIDFKADDDNVILNLDTIPWSTFIPQDQVEPGSTPKTPRILSISGCPLEIITETVLVETSGRVRVGTRESNCRWEVNPASSGVVPAFSRPVSHESVTYCNPFVSNEERCGDLGSTLIEDGPVVLAEEFENFSSFSNGLRRSKIILISDSSMVQGECSKKNRELLLSLVPESPSVNGREWSFTQKLRAPHAGSPSKYNAVSGVDLSLFDGNPPSGNLHLFSDNEDSFDFTTYNRPVEIKEPEKVKQRIESFYNNHISPYGIYPRFSGDFLGVGDYAELLGLPNGQSQSFITDAQIQGGLSELMKINNTDYLDYASGCVGDLFGYSVDISKDKIIVGSPFNAFEENVTWNGVVQSEAQVNVGERGGAGSAYIYHYTNSGVNAVSEFLPWEHNKSIKPESASVNDQFGHDVSIDCDMAAVGSLHHGYNTVYDHVYSGDSAFQRKSFNAEFTIPDYIATEVWNSGTPLDDGAVYTYRYEMTNFQTRGQEWVFAEKLNADDRISNSQFGRSVSIDRAYRGDSDYTLAVGASGFAHTFDAMLREQTPSIPNSGGWMEYKLFGGHDHAISGVVSQNETGGSLTHVVSGEVFANYNGDIFLEASGFDPSERGFIAHRPYIEKVQLQLVPGQLENDTLGLYMSGVPAEHNENMNLVMLGADQANVYNSLGMYSFGVTSSPSGVMSMYTVAPSGSSSGTLNMNLTSTQTSGILNLRVRGY